MNVWAQAQVQVKLNPIELEQCFSQLELHHVDFSAHILHVLFCLFFLTSVSFDQLFMGPTDKEEA